MWAPGCLWLMTGRPVEIGPLLNPSPHAPFPNAFRYSDVRKRAGAAFSGYAEFASQSNQMPASVPAVRSVDGKRLTVTDAE